MTSTQLPFEPRRPSQAARPHPPPAELDPDSREDDLRWCSLAAATAAAAVGVMAVAVAVPPLLLVVVTASIEARGTSGEDAEGTGGGGETILSSGSNSFIILIFFVCCMSWLIRCVTGTHPYLAFFIGFIYVRGRT